MYPGCGEPSTLPKRIAYMDKSIYQTSPKSKWTSCCSCYDKVYSCATIREQANFLSGLETRKGQLEAVEKTFKSVASTNLRNLKHPTNASLTVAEILPIYPDFEHWSNNLIHGIFTEDPTPHTSQTTSKSDEEASLNQVKLEEALLRRIDVGAEEQQFYGYYTPNDSTATTLSNYRKRLRDNDDEEVELAGKLNYDFVRDYSFTMVDVEDRMIMRLQKGVSAFYQSFNQTLRLKKKRAGVCQPLPQGIPFLVVTCTLTRSPLLA